MTRKPCTPWSHNASTTTAGVSDADPRAAGADEDLERTVHHALRIDLERCREQALEQTWEQASERILDYLEPASDRLVA